MGTSVKVMELVVLISFIITFTKTVSEDPGDKCWSPSNQSWSPSNQSWSPSNQSWPLSNQSWPLSNQSWPLSNQSRSLLRVGIYGGHNAHEYQFPFMVALRIQYDHGEYIEECGGTIISSLWILTAGHCFVHEGKKVTAVRVLYNNVALDRMLVRDIENVFVHPQYRLEPNFQMYNDIALVKLSAPLPDLPGTLPICIASESTSYFGPVTATGWGWRTASGVTPNILQYTTLDMITMQHCLQGFNPIAQQDKKLCTFRTGTGTWRGDSGGPIVAQVRPGTHIQIGIVSYGHGTTPQNYPDVYTKISSYADWIKHTTHI